MNTDLDLTADIIDVRDIIARIEELNDTYDDCPDNLTHEDGEELSSLRYILDELKGYGGDEQWRGDWYPITLINESCFVEYVKEMLADCGDIPSNIPDYVVIDWEATARNIKVDYSEVDIAGRTYFYR